VDGRAGTLHGTPAVQPGFFGSHVGVIDLDLRREVGAWRVAGHRVRALPVPPDAPADPALCAAVEPAHRRLLAVTGRPVGTTRVPLHSYFSLVGSDATLDVVADAQRAEARRLLRGRPEADLPVLCTVSPFKAGGRGGPDNYIEIPPGPLAFRQAADLYVYPNTFCLAEITGRGLREWLDRSAALFLTLTPGLPDQPLLDPEAPSYNFDTIDGLTWALDLSLGSRTDPWGRVVDSRASRVRDLRHEGRPVADADRFVLATSSYRMATGGSFAAAAEARVILRSPTFIRDIVLAHVRAGPVEPAPRPRWRFAPLPGTSALFDSGPGAARYPADAARRSLEPLGGTPDGFQRFRLRL
jgi:2',3'-cyclic-nucleotide 2'-phosphodiesterase/3'-nucleotidase